MIGSSNIFFKRDDKIELHVISSSEFLKLYMYFKNDEEAKNKIIIDSIIKNSWTPDAIVTEQEMRKIMFATSTIRGHKRYHKFAGDCNQVVNFKY